MISLSWILKQMGQVRGAWRAHRWGYIELSPGWGKVVGLDGPPGMNGQGASRCEAAGLADWLVIVGSQPAGSSGALEPLTLPVSPSRLHGKNNLLHTLNLQQELVGGIKGWCLHIVQCAGYFPIYACVHWDWIQLYSNLSVLSTSGTAVFPDIFPRKCQRDTVTES